jgi:hypothetical protein
MRLKKYTEYIKESININGLTKTDIELMLEDLTLDRKTFPEELEISISQTKWYFSGILLFIESFLKDFGKIKAIVSDPNSIDFLMNFKANPP